MRGAGRRHHNLYMMFKNQDYPGEIELLVGDGKCHKASCGGKKNTNSGVEPDSHFTEVAKTDPRVQYFFVDPGATTKAMTLGRKRNFLVEKGSGDIVVHFGAPACSTRRIRPDSAGRPGLSVPLLCLLVPVRVPVRVPHDAQTTTTSTPLSTCG